MSASDTANDQEPLIIKLSIAMIILPTVFVILRFWSRRVTQTGQTGVDDWLALSALCLSITTSALSCSTVNLSLSENLSRQSAGSAIKFLKQQFALDIIFIMSLCLTKLSATAFYARIFNTDRLLQKTVLIVNGFTIAFIIFGICYIFACTPISKAWNPTVPGHCVNRFAWFVTTAIWDALLDLAILIMPIPVLWKLQMKPARKWLLTAVFLVAYSSVVTSLGRLASIIKGSQSLQKDAANDYVEELAWSIVEVPACIVVICLPSVFYLCRRWKKGGFRALFSREDISRPPNDVIWENRRRNHSKKGLLPLHGGHRCERQTRDTSTEIYNGSLSHVNT